MILLDTNICIYVVKGRPPAVLARFNAHEPGDLGVSVITAMELRVGARKAGLDSRPARLVAALLDRLRVLPLEAAAIDHYATLRLALEGQGSVIGPMDLLIASHALALDATLVTHNTREFTRVPGLRVEDWADA